MSAYTLAGKNILIPGGVRGIGADLTKAAAVQGAANIVVGYVSSKKGAEELIENLKADKATSSTNIVAVQGNLIDQKSATNFVKEALSKVPGGKFNSLVYSAGVMKMIPLSDADEESFDWHFSKYAK